MKWGVGLMGEVCRMEVRDKVREEDVDNEVRVWRYKAERWKKI